MTRTLTQYAGAVVITVLTSAIAVAAFDLATRGLVVS